MIKLGRAKHRPKVRRAVKNAARDISYAYSAETRSGRAVIRVLENATGRLRLIKRARGYESEVANGNDFWDVMVQRYGLSLDVIGGSLSNIPKDGPLVLVANHPYGILDGLMMGHILSCVRQRDFRILAHRVFRKAEDLEKIILPISFDNTRDAMALNLSTRRTALEYLGNGGAIGVFPGGTVSTSLKPFSQPMDPGWRSFTAKMIAKAQPTVIPIYFEGSNSRLFQVASHLHSTLRMALLINEFKRKVDEPVKVVIGKPISPDDIQSRRNNPIAMMDFLRASTYALSPKPLRSLDYGFEFEDKHKRAMSDGRGHTG